jgi:Kef-type K+ transport system membrane component KefB
MAGSFRFLHDVKKSFLVGLGLCPRGEIALVVVKISLLSGIITSNLFTAITVMIIASIFITPVLLTKGFALASQTKGGPQSANER